MWRYALRRLSFLPIILIGVSIITFILLRVLPGDPAQIMCGQGCRTHESLLANVESYLKRVGRSDLMDQVRDAVEDPVRLRAINEELGRPPELQSVLGELGQPDQLDLIRKELGLDRPIIVQFFDWVTDLAQGDLGKTYYGKRDILDEVVRRFPASAELILLSLLISTVIGVLFGVVSAVMRNSPVDYAVRLFAVLGQSVPDFFLLVLLIIIPSILWNYAAPVGGFVSPFEDPVRNIRMYLPPAIILGIGGAAGIMRLERTTMLEVLRSDYVRTARAKGLAGHTVIMSHAFRNTLAPLVTLIGTSFTLIFSGSVIAERILSIDGLGVFFLDSVVRRDLPVVQFLVLYTGTVVVLANLVVDLSYAYIDPRVRYR